MRKHTRATVYSAVLAMGAFVAVPQVMAQQYGQQPNQMGQYGGQQAGQRSTGNVSQQDRQFIEQAASSGQLEVKLGQLASQKATSNNVKTLAQHMVQGHQQVDQQLKQLAQQSGIEIPQQLNQQDQQIYNRLKGLSGTQFDQAYLSTLSELHQRDIQAFQNQARNGSNPQLKQFASQTVPSLQKHLQMVQGMSGQGGGGMQGGQYGGQGQ